MDPTPFRLRFRVVLTLVPPVAGIAVGIALWHQQAEPEFFSAASHVLAIGAVGLALTGRFFRLAIHQHSGAAGAYAIANVVVVLVATGVGLFFCFHALAEGHSSTGDVAFVGAALASGIIAFGVQALFGTPGLEDEPSPDA
ncbi:MAG TPA: hypothetical protein VJT75_04905 [Thermoleophilaceae bacterium]|nr:hypothetical protein [Thermoleophilaceae bacterium]